MNCHINRSCRETATLPNWTELLASGLFELVDGVFGDN